MPLSNIVMFVCCCLALFVRESGVGWGHFVMAS